jgi:RNA polymerase sigma-70 factor (ECF subfamily)
MTDARDIDELLRLAGGGDESALAELFSRHRERLRRMVALRLDRRLHGRVDASDVLQEAYLDIARRASAYFAAPSMSIFLWMRLLIGQRLIAVHRHHFGAQKRDPRHEVMLQATTLPQATSASLAALLLGRMTSPSSALIRRELQSRVQDALNALDTIDREVLVLRHFEELSNAETAEALGIGQTTASNRYVRALRRLKKEISGIPGVIDSSGK